MRAGSVLLKQTNMSVPFLGQGRDLPGSSLRFFHGLLFPSMWLVNVLSLAEEPYFTILEHFSVSNGSIDDAIPKTNMANTKDILC